MKRFLPFALPAAVVALALYWGTADAGPRQVGATTGPLARSFVTAPGAGLLMQCQNQGVYVRAGCAGRADGGSNCVNDAGPAVDGGVGDLVVEFGASADPFPIRLSASEDRIWTRSTDGGNNACGFYLP